MAFPSERAPGQALEKTVASEEPVPSAEEGARGKSVSDRSATSQPASEGVLPTKAREDEDVSWGDGSGTLERERWLREQRPPHWD
ncbi:hypothetical protein [Arthrobacter sp. NPDC090010]|uniref:hypothetical protein n=1 Tax=Arthrobacter sp. NPDC090010 TaxID=3363942 RepID=UPI0037F7CF1B